VKISHRSKVSLTRYIMALVFAMLAITTLDFVDKYSKRSTSSLDALDHSQREFVNLKRTVKHYNTLVSNSPWKAFLEIDKQEISFNAAFSLAEFYKFEDLLKETYSSNGTFFLKKFNWAIDPKSTQKNPVISILLDGEKILVIGDPQ